ncbi:MAG: hypothetical protein M3295_09825 [Chloroflexota bacterium]|nr:hypothetical protein [Chloroflexota bacterium]
MTDVGFVVAAYAVTLVALAAYTAALWRRVARARATSLRIRDEAARLDDGP